MHVMWADIKTYIFNDSEILLIKFKREAAKAANNTEFEWPHIDGNQREHSKC